MGIKLAIVVSTIMGLLCAFKIFQYLSVPSYQSIIHISRDHDIKIYRDKYGVPHIQAHTLSDALYAQGFVQAQDRLWQLHIRKMASQGRLSEIFGERTLKIDQYFRSIDYMDSARRIVNQLSSEGLNLFQSYVDGINKGRSTFTLLPIEFQLTRSDFIEWEIFDVICFIKFMALTTINDFHSEMMRSSIKEFDLETIKYLTGIGPENLYDIETTTINEQELKEQTKLHSDKFQDLNISSNIKAADLMQSYEFLIENIIPLSIGSNSWAVHGNFTKTGYPFLASDPHLENGLPSQWYQSSTTFPNGEFMAGGAIVGLPYILSGRTKHLAWGITISYADSSDLYEEQLKEIDGKMHYLFKEEWLPTIEKVELIHYGDKTYQMKIHRTHHGPILNFYFDDRGTKTITQPDKTYSLRSLIDIDDKFGPEVMLQFIQGTDLAEQLKILKKVIYPGLGMIFASQKDIAYMVVGKQIIKSGNPDDFGFIKNGWNGQSEWLGFISEDEHPIIINPPKGFVATANNRFFPMNEKYHTNWNINPTGRAHRIYQFLNQIVPNKVSFEQMKQLQLDTVDSYAKQSWPSLRKLIQSDYFKQYIDSWDFNLNIESKQATLYMLFEHYYCLSFKNLPPRWSQTYNFDSFFFLELTRFNENGKWCLPLTCSQILNNAVEQAVKHFEQLPQKEWGNCHKKFQGHSTFKDKFFGIFDREIPFGGNRRTPSVSTLDISKFPFRGYAGANYRMLISMAPGEVGQFIVDGGVSGNPLSEHYDNQLSLYADGKYISMYQKQFEKLTLLKRVDQRDEL
ncbi:unnamed protein product [Paramecium sonneborni]|uniref:Penicillin amidase n=1 Tax=Paramecium sonneborni TaxID=65129 RepID=A0A8S1KSG1_9CILI|nr:unnamed protein product [Paramecium sonneborni]